MTIRYHHSAAAIREAFARRGYRQTNNTPSLISSEWAGPNGEKARVDYTFRGRTGQSSLGLGGWVYAVRLGA